MKTAGAPEISGRFDEMTDFSFTKEDIINYIPMMYMAALCAIVISLLIDFGYYFLCAFVVSWGAGIFTSLMHVKINGKKLFKMAVYAGTLSYIVQTIQILIGKSIPNFSLFSLIISTGYMYFAIKDCRDNGIEDLPTDHSVKEHREE